MGVTIKGLKPELEKLSSVANAVECMRHCQSRIHCHYWNYWTNSNNCLLFGKDGLYNRTVNDKAFSGPKFCDDLKYFGTP